MHSGLSLSDALASTEETKASVETTTRPFAGGDWLGHPELGPKANSNAGPWQASHSTKHPPPVLLNLVCAPALPPPRPPTDPPRGRHSQAHSQPIPSPQGVRPQTHFDPDSPSITRRGGHWSRQLFPGEGSLFSQQPFSGPSLIPIDEFYYFNKFLTFGSAKMSQKLGKNGSEKGPARANFGLKN